MSFIGAAGAEPLWFGEPGRLQFGWLHTPPSGKSRGAVVICGPLAKQYDTSYYTVRVLAEQLAVAGFTTLRFDYQGTGNSDGECTEQGIVECWQSSVAAASQFLDSLGCQTVALVGLQAGALFAAHAAVALRTAPALVLWDSPASGSDFLRKQAAIASLSMEARTGEDGSFESPGQLWTADAVRDLGAVAFPTAGLSGPTLVLSRLDTRPPRALREALSGPEVEWQTFSGHDDWHERATVPTAAVDHIVEWLRETPAAQPVAVERPPECVAVVHSSNGTPVRETALRMGDNNLFGILAEGTDADGPTIILVGGYIDPHTGPGRTWVTLSRDLAAAGHRALRLDLSGIGDSGVRSGQKPQQHFAAEGAEDIGHVAVAVSPSDPTNVVLVGFCAGAYAAIEAAAILRPRGVVTVNYGPYFEPPETAEGGDIDPRRAAVGKRPSWLLALRERGIARRLRALIPEGGWQLLNSLGIVPLPTRGFTVLLNAGVPLRAIAGPEDAEIFQARTPRRLARMMRSHPFSFVVLDDVRHAMLSSAERLAVVHAVTGEIEVLLAMAR